MERVDVLAGCDVGALSRSSVVVVGCGALGSAVSAMLARSGVGSLRIVDRDIVERRNLVDQALYTEADVAARTPKAEAAAAYLAGLNETITVDGIVADFGVDNALELTKGADLLIDAADNVETKFLLNDVAVATGTPLVYGGCAGTMATVLVVRPGVSHCMRCLWPEPQTLSTPTCQTMGVLPSSVAMAAALQYGEALKMLLGLEDRLIGGLIRVSPWDASTRRVPLPDYPGRANPCPACMQGEFAYLDGSRATMATPLCGDDTVLLNSPNGSHDFEGLARRRRDDPTLRVRPLCIEFEVDDYRILVFSSGKTLVHGTGDPVRARSLHAQHVAG